MENLQVMKKLAINTAQNIQSSQDSMVSLIQIAVKPNVPENAMSLMFQGIQTLASYQKVGSVT
jgi:hypothetical protein